MKHLPLQAARILWGDDGIPRSADFADVYHPPVGAAAQARHVFLAGNGLPQRWAGRASFTIAETGFGLGNNFLATWAAWRDDPARPARLHYVAIDAHPPRHADLQRAHGGSPWPDLAAELLAAWPPLLPGLHSLPLAGGAVRLLLALGDVRTLLPELVFSADAFYLDGFAPALNPGMWERHVIRALARRARPGATAATWSVARELRDALASTGFVCERRPGIGGKRKVLQARYEPRFTPRATAPSQAPADAMPSPREAIVIGAGLAGACAAHALAAEGWSVQVLDRAEQPAAGSSGNPAGLFHATVHADHNPYSRLFQAAALYLQRWLPALGTMPLSQGLLRLEHKLDLAAMQALISRQGLPADFVQALDAAGASAQAGLPLAAPAWFYPGGGALAPAPLVRRLLLQHGIRFCGGQAVQALRQEGSQWACLGADGSVLARAPQVVLACAEQVNPLLASAGHAPLPLARSRGQVTVMTPVRGQPLPRVPVAGDGYVLALDDTQVLCGATTGGDEGDTQTSLADHQANLERLRALCGLRAEGGTAASSGRAGWRVLAPDRLPVAGPLPAPALHQGTANVRLDQARLLPRERGLHVATAFGARGITLAPLVGAVVAARITGSPVPLAQGLVDAIDPGRWLVRQARQANNG
ncbi:FAD-dependent 5-carboxymethylaminomethyl-2-thiouridine(34) oxidoreductase MnmC [Pseudorhodoferax sp.]|uniref:FAD-dependent 5-carboxymethylaminomethyl-2-thiouridine(34) oxidoreductase MnmC n=1 Tax=Pseudorhodoferax sp. TaxID=1993553 RepID=UPI002DD6AD7C|nr:FAD-dependent 5-carboxymethylaminomethyl-2-thiouridine(34) oxidoreductase MnmC [Pseudorhodoferax sp.]